MWHTLALLDEAPIERLRRSLLRARSADFTESEQAVLEDALATLKRARSRRSRSRRRT